MKIACFEIKKDGRLSGLRDNDLVKIKNTKRIFDLWVDIEFTQGENLREQLLPLGVSERIIEVCSEERRSLPFQSQKKELYMEYPVHSDWREKKASYVSFIMVPGILFTLHRRSVPRITSLAEELTAESIMGGPSNSFLLTKIMQELGMESFQASLNIRDETERIALLLDDKPGSVVTDDIISLKRQADCNSTTFLDQLYCFTRLTGTESDVFSAKEQAELHRILHVQIQQANDIMKRIEKRLEAMLNQFQLVLQDKSNNRLQILTVVSAVFMPLTLLAGIYGMNFKHMPILDFRYGYPTILALMGCVAVGMIIFFKFRKWF